MKILLLSGSSRTPSHTFGLTLAAAGELAKLKAYTSVWDLHTKPIPFADADYHKAPSSFPNPTVKALVSLAEEADAFVLGSPNYHNSYSGLLKNALDFLTMDQFYSKPVGLLTHSGGMRSTQAVDQLRIVVRGLLGVAIPVQVATCDSDFRFDEKNQRYVLSNESIEGRIEGFAHQLVHFARQITPLWTTSQPAENGGGKKCSIWK